MKLLSIVVIIVIAVTSPTLPCSSVDIVQLDLFSSSSSVLLVMESIDLTCYVIFFLIFYIRWKWTFWICVLDLWTILLFFLFLFLYSTVLTNNAWLDNDTNDVLQYRTIYIYTILYYIVYTLYSSFFGYTTTTVVIVSECLGPSLSIKAVARK